VSGRLGLSALGLRLLRSRRTDLRRSTPFAEAIEAHLYPFPQCALGRYLSAKGLASALIDVSDGLSTDLGHLCESSGVGARIWESLVPALQPTASHLALEVSPFELALHGGEDYQLLFTVPPRKVSLIPRKYRGLSLHRIGEVRASKKLILVRANGKQETVRPAGYDHFRNWTA
jgi:thiamine-monophosphate kinase